LWPRKASPDAKLALVVVLPTPPLPEVTTMILAIRLILFYSKANNSVHNTPRRDRARSRKGETVHRFHAN
jgi:hypothetical protein